MIFMMSSLKHGKKKIILLSAILLLCLHTMGMTYNAHTLCTLLTPFFVVVPNFSFEIARLIWKCQLQFNKDTNSERVWNILVNAKVTVGGLNDKYPEKDYFLQIDQSRLPHNLGTLIIMKNQWYVKEIYWNIKGTRQSKIHKMERPIDHKE